MLSCLQNGDPSRARGVSRWGSHVGVDSVRSKLVLLAAVPDGTWPCAWLVDLWSFAAINATPGAGIHGSFPGQLHPGVLARSFLGAPLQAGSVLIHGGLRWGVWALTPLRMQRGPQ